MSRLSRRVCQYRPYCCWLCLNTIDGSFFVLVTFFEMNKTEHISFDEVNEATSGYGCSFSNTDSPPKAVTPELTVSSGVFVASSVSSLSIIGAFFP